MIKWHILPRDNRQITCVGVSCCQINTNSTVLLEIQSKYNWY